MALVTEGHKILKPKMPLMSWMMLEKYCIGEGSSQNSSIYGLYRVMLPMECKDDVLTIGSLFSNPRPDFEILRSLQILSSLGPCPIDISQLTNKYLLVHGRQ